MMGLVMGEKEKQAARPVFPSFLAERASAISPYRFGSGSVQFHDLRPVNKK